MTDKTILQIEVERFIFEEAALIDQARWQAWLEMYTEDMVYWAPSWVNEQEMTTASDMAFHKRRISGVLSLT